MKGYNKRKCCAGCNSVNFYKIIDLGIVPLAGYFPTDDQLAEKSEYPLSLLFCLGCTLIQTDSIIDSDILFKDYRYMSSISLTNHFSNVAKQLHEKYNIVDKHILEIGCNDGVLLKPLSAIGAIAEGVDPATNIVKLAVDKGLTVYNNYFNYENFSNEKFKNRYDLVLSNNTFAHIHDIQDVLKGIKHVLKPNGNFIFEVHYVKNLIEENQWDNVYHEHIYYYSITSLVNMFAKYNMTVVDFEEIDIHAGSIRVTVNNKSIKLSTKIQDRIYKESKTICNSKYLHSYKDRVTDQIINFKQQLKTLSQKYKIAGYGASGRANMFCNITNLNNHDIKFIVDESPERCGRYIANTKIPIVDLDTLKNSDIDLLIIFAWNYSKMIIDKTQFNKFKYLVAFPYTQLVDDYTELKDFKSI